MLKNMWLRKDELHKMNDTMENSISSSFI